MADEKEAKTGEKHNAWLAISVALIAVIGTVAAAFIRSSNGPSEKQDGAQDFLICNSLGGIYRAEEVEDESDDETGFPAHEPYCGAAMDSISTVECEANRIAINSVSFNQIFRTWPDDRTSKFCSQDKRDAMICGYTANWRFTGNLLGNSTFRIYGKPDSRRGLEDRKCSDPKAANSTNSTLEGFKSKLYGDYDRGAECDVDVESQGDRLRMTCRYDNQKRNAPVYYLERWKTL